MMVVISRRTTESVQIGDGVVVTILGIWRGQVRVSVKCGSTQDVEHKSVILSSQNGVRIARLKKNDSLLIDGTIVVTMIEFAGDKIRIGIQAPLKMTIHRLEVLEAILGAKTEEPIQTTTI